MATVVMRFVFTVIIIIIAVVLGVRAAHADCDVSFDCGRGKAKINGKTYPIVCGRLTGRGMEGGSIGHLIRASGPWRPGLVAPGTPMITTAPQLCHDCFVHVSDVSRSFSNGCLGTTYAAFSALKACGGSRFSITAK